MPTYARKVDDNQAEIVAALERIGVSVWVIGQPVDLMVGYRGRTGALEVKRCATTSKRDLTPQQVEFFDTDRGFHRIVCSVDDAIRAVQDMTK